MIINIYLIIYTSFIISMHLLLISCFNLSELFILNVNYKLYKIIYLYNFIYLFYHIYLYINYLFIYKKNYLKLFKRCIVLS